MIRNIKLTIWETTPKELHEIADRLQAAHDRTAIGQPIANLLVEYQDGVQLRIVIDVEEMARQKSKSLRIGSTDCKLRDPQGSERGKCSCASPQQCPMGPVVLK